MASASGRSESAASEPVGVASEQSREALARFDRNARDAKRRRIEQGRHEDDADPLSRYYAECRRRRDGGVPIAPHAEAMLAAEDEMAREPYDCSPEGDRAAERHACANGFRLIERSLNDYAAPVGVSLKESMSAALELSARKLDRRIETASRRWERARRPRMWSPRRRGSCGRPRARARRTQRSTRAGPDTEGESEPPGEAAGRHTCIDCAPVEDWSA